ncbi:MAG: gliding motility-associated C-terminal domain-containing protein [Bacteroidota bacterium]|nr:gliding motility-associated C-terminal domain-containing protein [Bacteroidota bacterium]
MVKLKVLGYPPNTTFEWDLGFGYTSATDEYNILYSKAGFYDVKVRFTFQDGSKCVISNSNFINARPSPIPAFSASKLSLCDINDSIFINDITPNSIQRDWLIDNNTYNNDSSSIVKKLNLPYGYKSMTIFVKDKFGCRGNKTFDSAFYLPRPLNVDFEVNKSNGCLPANISFINKSDTDDLTIGSWLWSLPGSIQNTSTQKSPKNIIYNTQDSFNVQLIGITNVGCRDTITKMKYLAFGDSVAIGLSFSSTDFCAGEKLVISHNNIRNNKPQISFTPNTFNILSSNATQTVVKFSQNGFYNISVKDQVNGCTSERNITNAFNVKGSVARFTIDNTISCIKPDTFKTEDNSLIPNGVTKTLNWNLFYDSIPNVSLQNSTLTKVNFIGNYFTKYTIRLIVSGSDGCIDTLTRRTAFEVKKIKPEFIWAENPSCVGEIVKFTNNTPRGTNKVRNQYKWEFFNLNGTIIKSDTNTNPQLTYPSKGRYKVKLIAFNSLGCRDTLTRDTHVLIINPTPSFFISDTNLCYKQATKLKVIYQLQDTAAYRKYYHIWYLNHQDSSNVKYNFEGDSPIINNMLPGIYNIIFRRYSKTTYSCNEYIPLSIKIRVSGVFNSFVANPIQGCQPFISDIRAIKTYSYNYKNNTPSASSVFWKNYYDTNFLAIRQPTLNPTKVFVKRKGDYAIEMVSEHTSGCKDSSYLPRIRGGFIASFYHTGRYEVTCIDKPYALINNSNPGFASFKWFILDSISGFQISPSNISKDVSITFSKKGYYRIMLVGYGNAACNDTIIRGVSVDDIKADFFSEDTINYCAPVIVRLNAKQGSDIISYKWQIDKTDVPNTSPNIGYLIKRNTGPEGIDVKLMVSGFACSDTIEKKAFFKVIGPIADFSALNNVGCEKLNVQFVNKSKYFNKFYLEFGDGSNLDSQIFKNHIYQIYDRALPLQKFYPILTLVDSFNCAVDFKQDTVTVFKAPQSNFNVDIDSGCAMLDVKFRNLTIGATSYKWDFENENRIRSTQFAPSYQFKPGFYQPKLISTSANGCSDTLSNSVTIKSYENPNVEVNTSADTICFKGKIDFTTTFLSSHSSIVSFKWDFGNHLLQNDTSTKRNPSYVFVKPLLNLVSLNVVDNYGCRDTVEKFIYVYDTIGPESEPINYITVDNDKDITINWSKSKFKKFNRYYLFNDNSGYNFINSFGNKNDTSFKITSGIDVSQSRYCYVIRTEDQCKNIGKPSFPHCTILVKIADSINKLVLSWLPYEGWGTAKVERYRIYRKEANGNFKLHDSTTQTTYTDDNLCPKLYCYYVVAVSKSGNWLSVSNISCKTPKYVPPTEPVKSIRTTVLDNGNTLLEWLPYKFIRNVKRYHISRYYDGSSKDKFYATTDSLFYIDDGYNLFTNLNSYSYWVRAEDHCGAQSPESSQNKTILLKGKSTGYIAKVQWTPYQKWPSGIKKYEVLFEEDGVYRVLGTTDPNSQNFEFDFLDTKMDDSLCFRIRAIKDTTIDVVSLSNIVCLISDPQMFVPSAFSPNKDGKNEIFLPQTILIFNKTGNPIKDYYMEIYNRWGEKVFESNDATIGWDGTYKGNTCQEGVYIYKARGLGLDGITTFNLEGVVTLLR